MNVIAIDGPVAAGKTVVGRELALRVRFRFLDTGVMYRAITWLALHCLVPMEDEEALSALAHNNAIRLNGRDSDRVVVGGHQVGLELRDPEVDNHVSLVARVPGVRRAMVQQQREMAAEGKMVMVGRDIGTVVLPDAGLKVFMRASAEERARRRWQDLARQGYGVDFQQVLRETIRRDEIDSNRTDSPLRPAEDAFLVDTDGLSIEQVVDRILQLLHQVCGTSDR